MFVGSFNEPAKQAERVLAPGEGEAEPGVRTTNFREPAKLATDASQTMKKLESNLFLAGFICRPLRGLGSALSSTPQARLRYCLGLALFPPASQAG